MKGTDFLGKGIRSFDKGHLGKTESSDLPDLEDAESQEEMSVTVEEATAESEAGTAVGVMVIGDGGGFPIESGDTGIFRYYNYLHKGI